MVSVRVLLPVIAAAQLAFPVGAQTTEALRADAASIQQQIAEVDGVLGRYDGGLIVALAEMRREALLLSKAVLESRILAAEGGLPTEVVVPAVQPDEARATQIITDIADAQRRIAAAEKDAAQAGGLMQAVALSRVETEKLTLAQLQMAYFQAKYGIAFPTPPQLGTSAAAPVRDGTAAAAESAAAVTDALPWADPRFPAVDYSIPPFEQAHRDGDRISGWWAIESERAAVDDSPQITAINYSQYEKGSFGGLTALIARCNEGESALIFVQDDFLMSDFQTNSFNITYRLDDEPAREMRWNGLTSNKGAGLFGRDAEQFLRQLYDTKQLFVRLTEHNGQQHDAVFDLSGGQDAYEAVAAACSWTTLTLSADDYRAIQTMLNAGGFDAGTPDGQWGSGSQQAMKAFQKSVGLAETGAPDRATLSKLGFAN